MTVRFKCDGEDEPVSMAVTAFREHCKSLGMPAQEEKKAGKAAGKTAGKAAEAKTAAKAKAKSPPPAAEKKPPKKKAKQSAETEEAEAEEETKEEEEEAAAEDEEVAAKGATDPSGPPAVDERFFVPASLWPDEKPTKTAHGKGWLASIVSVAPAATATGKKRKSAGSSNAEAEMTVRFKCDGEDEPVSMAVAAFREHCKSLGMPK